jgi:hypothetical protein
VTALPVAGRLTIAAPPGRLNRKGNQKMGISQEVLIAVYGELVQVANRAEQTLREMERDDTLDLENRQVATLMNTIADMQRFSETAQRRALDALMGSVDARHINPLTGEIE